MPNVVIEALTCGCPVAATDVGACRELLAGEPAGRIVPVGDSAALAEAIVSLVGRPADRAAMAARHRDRFSWERQAQTILGLLARRESR
jgi:glycosyltransferase involved in cell wall biosynthesis